jgi:glutathione S-transferase
VNRWLFWCGQDFMPGVSLLNWENAIKALAGLGAPDAEAVARGEGLLTEAAGILDAHLTRREWICGAGLSLADFALGAPLIDQERARLPIADLPHLQRWLGRLRALDAWKATVA